MLLGCCTCNAQGDAGQHGVSLHCAATQAAHDLQHAKHAIYSSSSPVAHHGGLTSETNVPLAQVIVVEDENGNIVRETMKDTDTLARYKTMHETLVYLSHLDHDDTENQMLEKLRLQVGTYCCRLRSALCLR